MEEKMLPWKVWDCNLILGLRAPSPSSAPPRPPVHNKTSAWNLVKTHLLIRRRPKIQWSQNLKHFHRNPTLVCTRRGCTYTQIIKTSVPLPSPSCWGKAIHASIQNIYMLQLIPAPMSDLILFTLFLLIFAFIYFIWKWFSHKTTTDYIYNKIVTYFKAF